MREHLFIAPLNVSEWRFIKEIVAGDTPLYTYSHVERCEEVSHRRSAVWPPGDVTTTVDTKRSHKVGSVEATTSEFMGIPDNDNTARSVRIWSWILSV